jgi:hypothetical protein
VLDGSFTVQTFSEDIPDGNIISTIYFPLCGNVLIIENWESVH